MKGQWKRCPACGSHAFFSVRVAPAEVWDTMSPGVKALLSLTKYSAMSVPLAE